MKNKIVLIGLALVAIAVFSCKKDYTCKCSKTYADSTGTGTVKKDDGSYIFKDSKTRATDECDGLDKTGADLNGDYNRQCTIQ
jgi:hypothetical protein